MANVFQTLQALLQTKQYSKLITLVTTNRELLKHPDIGHMYGFALRQSGAINEALSFYNKAARQFPTHPGILVGAANLFANQGKMDKAIKLLQKATSANPNEYDPSFNLARLYSRQERFEVALEFYEKAVKIKPSSVQALVGKADCLMNLGHKNKSKQVYEQALSLSSSYIPALNNYAKLCRATDDNAKAVELYKQAISLAPLNSDLRRNLAATLVLVDDIDAARDQYQTALENDPTSVELHMDYAKFNWVQDDPQPFSRFQDAIERYPNKPELRIAYIQLLLRNDDGDGAYKALGRLLTNFPEDKQVIAIASAIHRMRGDLDLATSFSNKLYENRKTLEDKTMLNEHGYNSLAIGDSDTALKIYTDLVKSDPDNQGNWTLYSTALRESKREKQFSDLMQYEQTITSYQDEDKQRADRLKSELIRLHNTEKHPIDQSLRYGTQTLENIFASPSNELAALQDYISEKTQQHLSTLKKVKDHPFLRHVGQEFYFNNAWSVNLFTHGFHKSHFHPQGWLSGVYYVDVPDCVNERGQGWITFGKAEIPNLDEICDFAVKPQIGLLVLFPSFMWHGTRPFTTNSNRMTVVVDILPK